MEIGWFKFAILSISGIAGAFSEVFYFIALKSWKALQVAIGGLILALALYFMIFADLIPLRIFRRIKDAWHLGIEDWREAIRDLFSQLKRKNILCLEKVILGCMQFMRLIALENIKHFVSSDKMKYIRLKRKYQFIDKYVLGWVVILLLLLFLTQTLITHIWSFLLKIIFIIVVSVWLLSVAGIVIKVVRDYQVFKCFCWPFIFFIACWFLILGIVLWRSPWPVIVFIAFYRLLEILSIQFGNIFIDREILSLNRSIFLLGINYIEIIVIFAIMYYFNNIITTPTAALYFSAVTITSLGSCDLKPISRLGKVLATSEPILGLVIISFVIGAFFTFYANNRRLW